MPRPKRFRKIFREPEIRCFKPDVEDNIEELSAVQITMDEFEAIRLKDYKKISQNETAGIMGVSQPTLHRILNSARENIAMALVEGKILNIKGGDYMTVKKRYKCKKCGFEWLSPEKEYEKCPDCKSEDIYTVETEEELQKPLGQPGLGRGGGRGGRGMGAGPPRVCKCPNCGYEAPKTQGIPCRNTKCPECETPLCGAD
jgi:uncharacterized protein